MEPQLASHLGQASLTDDELASLDAFVLLTPLQRFDQLVRTARFIAAGRVAVGQEQHG